LAHHLALADRRPHCRDEDAQQRLEAVAGLEALSGVAEFLHLATA
jgi:hypothetical protein